MKTFHFYTAVIFFQALITVSFSHFAFAEHDRGEFNRGMMDQQIRAFSVKIEGEMSCQVVEPKSCTLKIRDSKTGRNFKIKGSDQVTEDALTLYRTGETHVAIEGNFTDSETVSMQQIRKY